MKKTVVFRGSVVFDKHPKNFLEESVKVLRAWFDDEVIVSTWEGQEKYLTKIDGIDKVVISKDPGPGPIQHLNRQVMSYENGVENANGDLVLVTRTDFMHFIDLFQFYGGQNKVDFRYKIFKSKLLIGNMMSINPLSYEVPNTYRLADWFQMGLKEDVANWGCISKQIKDKTFTSPCTEKIWLTSCLSKNGLSCTPEDTSAIDKDFWHYVISNFVIKNTKSTLKSINMNWINQPENLPSYITEELYNAHYDNHFP